MMLGRHRTVPPTVEHHDGLYIPSTSGAFRFDALSRCHIYFWLRIWPSSMQPKIFLRPNGHVLVDNHWQWRQYLFSSLLTPPIQPLLGRFVTLKPSLRWPIGAHTPSLLRPLMADFGQKCSKLSEMSVGSFTGRRHDQTLRVHIRLNSNAFLCVSRLGKRYFHLRLWSNLFESRTQNSIMTIEKWKQTFHRCT